ncbi:unnamed protein product [Blepharisma stoltei]|uniref:B box-type domain-containing protein n=1 Tax=Blepharisma stoltei TaxID=1481888 RepID=A0AAU9JT69_9CILI|nr:unnamed protein product [Blepharisma stoltei]
METNKQCQLCKQNAELICFCTQILLCSNCIGTHLIKDTSIIHNPISLKDTRTASLMSSSWFELKEKESQIITKAKIRDELNSACRLKLHEELTELENFKKESFFAIDQYIDKLQKELSELGEFLKEKVNKECENKEKIINEAIDCFASGNTQNNYISNMLAGLKTKGEIDTLKLITKKIGIHDFEIRDAIMNKFDLQVWLINSKNNERTINTPYSGNSLEIPTFKTSHNISQTPKASEASKISKPRHVSRPSLPDPEIINILENSPEILLNMETPESSPISQATPIWDEYLTDTNPFSPDTSVIERTVKSPMARSATKKSFAFSKSNRPVQKSNSGSKLSKLTLEIKKNPPKNPNALYCFFPNQLIIYHIDSGNVEQMSLHNKDLGIKGNAWTFSPDGYIFATGGLSLSAKRYLWIFNTNNYQLDPGPPMKIPRYNHASLISGNYLYVIGGCNFASIKDCERFNLISKKWQQIGNLNVARENLAACVHKGRIFVAGGIKENSIESYNAVNNKFSLLRIQMPIGGSSLMFSYKDQILIFHCKQISTFDTISCSDYQSLEEEEWWSPTDVVEKNGSFYFISRGTVYKYDPNEFQLSSLMHF